MTDAESVKGSVLGNDGRKSMGECAEKPKLVYCIRICRLGTCLVVWQLELPLPMQGGPGFNPGQRRDPTCAQLKIHVT